MVKFVASEQKQNSVARIIPEFSGVGPERAHLLPAPRVPVDEQHRDPGHLKETGPSEADKDCEDRL